MFRTQESPDLFIVQDYQTLHLLGMSLFSLEAVFESILNTALRPSTPIYRIIFAHECETTKQAPVTSQAPNKALLPIFHIILLVTRLGNEGSRSK